MSKKCVANLGGLPNYRAQSTKLVQGQTGFAPQCMYENKHKQTSEEQDEV
jgi:hypothetical protein